MRIVSVVVVVALLAAYATAGSVVELTSANFESHITSNDLTLVKFYAPWCGHCKSLAPEFDEAAKRLEGGDYLAKVDCTVESKICGDYGVRGYPTLYLIKKDLTKVEYDQARKADAIVKFINKYRLPAYTFTEESAVKDFVAAAGEDLKVVFYAENDAAVDTFKALADANRDDGDFTIVKGASESKTDIYRNGELVASEKGANADAIKKVITVEKFPLIGEIGPDNYAKYVDRDLPLIWVFVPYDSADSSKILDSLTPVAKEYREKYLFVKLDSNRWGDHGRTFGVTSYPGVALEMRTTRKNYIFPSDQTISTDAFTQFLKDFEAGKVAPNVRSEEIPASNDGPVTVIVGKTWDDIVLDTKKDVLVEFYAPWCGHCKALAPKYEQLGEEFKAIDSVVIGKIDGTENDVPIDIAGFPTIYLYPANNKDKPIQYSGSRTVEDLAKFVRENGDTVKDAEAAAAAASARTEL